MFMGFTLHFNIIFGTNLLTEAQPELFFFAYFSVSKNRKISNGVRAIFLEQTQSKRLEVDIKKQPRRP